MTTVTVTKQFKEDFDLWAKHAMDNGEFSVEDMTELKTMLRQDLQPGPDKLRDGPAVMNDYVERIRVWTAFFADKADQIAVQESGMKHVSEYLKEGLREHLEERAAILEYCAAYPRREAERLAMAEVAKWLKAHPEDDRGND